MMKKANIYTLFEIFQKENPDPKGELNHVNSYTLLVAVVLSAQATDKGVNKATVPLFKKITTPEQMLDFGEEALRKAISSLNYYKTKAKNIIGLSQKLIDVYGSTVPNDQKALESLSGVGRKTANVVRSMAFGEATVAVDTHVFRVSHRLKLATGKTPDKLGDQLEKVIPKKFLYHAHHWLILHGRYTCVARKPKCAQCKVQHLCKSADKII